MRGESENLRESFIRATELVQDSLSSLAEELGCTRRALTYWRSGERGVSPEVARRLAACLRRKGGALLEAAEELERAAEEAEDE